MCHRPLGIGKRCPDYTYRVLASGCHQIGL